MLYYICCTVAGLTVEASRYLTLMWMLAAAVRIFYVQHTAFEGGGKIDMKGAYVHSNLFFQGRAVVLQRKTEDGEYVEVGQLGPSDYFGKFN